MTIGQQRGAVFLFALQWENKKARKGGVLPSAHQIALLQFQIHLVFFVEVQQDSVGGGFSCDVFVTGERRDDWLSIQHQIHLKFISDRTYFRISYHGHI